MKVFLLLLLLAVLLSATVTSLVFLFTYTYSSQPSLLVLSRSSDDKLFCTSYASSSLKIKTMADTEKHGSAMIAASTPKVDKPIASDGTVIDSVDKAYFVPNGKSSLEGKNFKTKSTIALINAKVSKNDKNFLNKTGILVQKDDAPFALVLFKAVVICKNEDYALEQYGLSVFEALKSSNGKKDSNYAKNLKAWKKDYEDRQANEFIKVYTYNAGYSLKEKTVIVRDNEADPNEIPIKTIENDPGKMESVLSSIQSALL